MAESQTEEYPTGYPPAERTSYVGRDTEIREARSLLEEAALVTLTGPGGVGKTRLALRTAAAARASFGENVVFVGLAELHEPELLVSTVADRLGLGDRSAQPPIDLLVDQLRARRLLLVLDNCEHLVDACAAFADILLRSCPELVVLATSRQSLGVMGERVLPVPPLAVPDPGRPADELTRYDAVRLFVDRATAVVPGFSLDEDNAEDVVLLCRALDGMPLAMELAAARLRTLSVRQLTERLNDRFTLLTGGRRTGPDRHSTLQALVDWSHGLCTREERQLWAHASVFAESFDIEAAEAVCADGELPRDAVLDAVDGLIDKSILFREELHGVVRYRMLETMRQYGEDQLHAMGRGAGMRLRHRDWYLELTRRFEAEWLGPEQVAWINRLKREHANLRAALDFCVHDPGEAVVGLRMIRAFKEYWVLRGLNTEGRIWLGRLLDAAPADAAGRAYGLWIYAFLALVQRDLRAYETAVTQAAEVAEETGDEQAQAYVHHVRAYAALIGDDNGNASKLFQLAAGMFRDCADVGGELWSTYNYGLARSLAGDLTGGREVLRRSARACAATGQDFWRSWTLWSRSAAEYLCGDIEEAKKAGRELLRLQHKVDDRLIIAFTLTVMAGCAVHSDLPARAARLFGAATTVWQSLGTAPTNYAAFIEPLRRASELVVGRLGAEQAFREARAGAALSLTEALAYALDEEPAGNPLTKRENEIAVLVGKGMTNREIAGHLVIARRTAETHIEHILGKLGFTNRAQIAAWVAKPRR
ncbi:LuxR C-terminal-related transcriptional regulator [Amycolatopsis nigrescens]|uniref:LuxR C-terminal-related transcriptional regulator n=1 Tax=Amycolatopsis nigrescens TaxID=381445 RepID=UPI00037819A4|nr:LuxR C-terminal-related transcriptional regulator [Amycolatopsis nigrescens]